MITYKIIDGKGYSKIEFYDMEFCIENKALDIIHQISNLLMLKKYKDIVKLIKTLEIEIE